MSKLICLDAGHGGADSGAVNGGWYEKAVTLAVVRMLAEELKQKGYKVILTRNEDVTLSLAQRCKISNNAKADIFVSIHCNSANNKAASGIETWRHHYVWETTKRLAANVQNRLADSMGAKNRGVKEGAFYVLKNTDAPAILVELGFISNDDEKRLLFKSSYQAKLAHMIARGIEDTVPL